MGNNEFFAEIAKNLLRNQTCNVCNNQQRCAYKSRKKYNTCRKWKKEEFSFSIDSYSLTAAPRKLNVTWTMQTELDLKNTMKTSVSDLLDIKEESNNMYKVLSDWKNLIKENEKNE
jgi:hypothetical protein